jgi:hypothetical protein
MIEQGTFPGVKLLPAGLALLAVLIGAECVRAGVDHYDPYETTGSIAGAATSGDLVAAELDPVFMQKLAQRWRAPYERSHAVTGQLRDGGN